MEALCNQHYIISQYPQIHCQTEVNVLDMFPRKKGKRKYSVQGEVIGITCTFQRLIYQKRFYKKSLWN